MPRHGQVAGRVSALPELAPPVRTPCACPPVRGGAQFRDQKQRLTQIQMHWLSWLHTPTRACTAKWHPANSRFPGLPGAPSGLYNGQLKPTP
jgi:hypothetical protein